MKKPSTLSLSLLSLYSRLFSRWLPWERNQVTFQLEM